MWDRIGKILDEFSAQECSNYHRHIGHGSSNALDSRLYAPKFITAKQGGLHRKRTSRRVAAQSRSNGGSEKPPPGGATSLAGRWARRVRFGLLRRPPSRDQDANQIVPPRSVDPMVGEPNRLIPKRTEDPRVASIVTDADGLPTLDSDRPNREEPS